MIAAAYLRKSNDEGAKDAEAKSVARQRERARAYAEAKGWELREEFIFEDDAISGAEFLKRPGFAALMKLVERPEGARRHRAPFDVLIVAEQSRIGRDAILTLAAMKTITDAGVRIFAYLEDRELKLAGSDLIVRMVGSYSDADVIEKTSVRVTDQKFSAVELGRVAGGRVYGYSNVREGKGKTVRVVNESEAAIVRRIFDLAGKGHGLKRIVNTLNDKSAPVPGPRYACKPVDRRAHEHSDACTRSTWEVSGVREVLHRELYRGVEVFGKTKRVREGGTKGKTRRPESEWKRVERPDLRMVTDAQWKAAHDAIAATNAVMLRRNGRLMGKPEAARGTSMLTGFLQCGVCGGRMSAMVRGRKNEKVYVCRTHLGRGNDVCANTTGVPADRLHAAVVAALRDTFTVEKFEAHLAQLADDEHARQARADERGRLLAQLPEMAAEEQRLARAIAQGVALDAIVAELKSAQARREAAEARIQELETMDRELKTQAELVEQLRGTIRDWNDALEGDTILARQVLRKILATPIMVVPRGRGQWTFAGYSWFDGLLTGRIAPDVTYLAKWGDREEIDALVREHIPEGTFLPNLAPISGGSDSSRDTDGSVGRTPEMAPHTPQRSTRPGEPGSRLGHVSGRGVRGGARLRAGARRRRAGA